LIDRSIPIAADDGRQATFFSGRSPGPSSLAYTAPQLPTGATRQANIPAGTARQAAITPCAPAFANAPTQAARPGERKQDVPDTALKKIEGFISKLLVALPEKL